MQKGAPLQQPKAVCIMYDFRGRRHFQRSGKVRRANRALMVQAIRIRGWEYSQGIGNGRIMMMSTRIGNAAINAFNSPEKQHLPAEVHPLQITFPGDYEEVPCQLENLL